MKTNFWQACMVFAILGVLPPMSSAQDSRDSRAAAKSEIKVYLAEDESARRVMENMLSMFGRKLVGSRLPNNPVSGRFEARSVEDVMKYFQSAYQLNWFANGVNIYAYNSSDWRTGRVYVGGDRSNEDWKELLTSAGLYYREFPFVFNQDNKELLLSGPQAYLNLVENAFKQSKPDPTDLEKFGPQLMVFPLKHASVEDRQTELRGNSVTTPGALSVLLNLLGLPNQLITRSPELKIPGMNVERAPLGGDLEVAGRVAELPASNKRSTADSSQASKDQELSVTADPRTNSILIRDVKTKYEYYKNLIEQLDRPVAMIEVEAMMVEVDQQGLNELGMEFGLFNERFQYEFPGESVGRPFLMPPGASSIVDPVSFMARLRALSADENAKVLARPTIVTQDNVAAYIDLSQTLYLRVTGERVADIFPITAGSLLQVTPRVVSEGGEDRIFMRIEIKDGNLTDSVDGISAPRIQNTSLSTQALIQREKAILIGGYNRDATETRDYKVPLLGDLPWIGGVFSSTEKTTQVVARLFLITPRLVDGPAHDSESTQKALNKLQMTFQLEEPNALPTPMPSLRLDGRIQR